MRRGFTSVRLLVGVIVGLAVGIPSLWGLLGRQLSSTVALYLDNGTDDLARVRLDDGAPVEVPKWSVATVQVKTGHHTLKALAANNDLLDEQSFDATGELYLGEAYVFNVAGKNHYATYTMAYGRETGDPPEPLAAPAHVFAMPVGVGLEFMGRFPESITVEKQDHSPRKERRLYHLPIHEDRPCCAAIRDLL